MKIKARFIKIDKNLIPVENLTIGKTYEGYISMYREFKVLKDDKGHPNIMGEGEFKVITNHKYLLINI